MRGSGARRFSLVELLLAVALSLLLIATVALLFGRFTLLQERIDDRLAGRRTVDALGGRLAGDTGRAVAIAELARCFDHAPTLVTKGSGAQIRLDQLELVVLDDQGELERVRWSVAWDQVAEQGFLWRETFPVAAAELPVSLTRLAGGTATRELVSGGVDRFELEVGGRAPDAPTTIVDLTVTGTGAKLLHDELTRHQGLLTGFGFGDFVWLKDDRVDRQSFREGYYRVRTVEADVVTFRKRIGNGGRVLFRGAKLPDQLSLSLIQGGTHAAVELPLGVELERREGVFVEPRVTKK